MPRVAKRGRGPRQEAGGKLVSSSKQGGHGRGCAGGSKVDHATVAKVAASSAALPVVAAKPECMVSLGPRLSVVCRTLPAKHFQTAYLADNLR